jgi:hypothetical protein
LIEKADVQDGSVLLEASYFSASRTAQSEAAPLEVNLASRSLTWLVAIAATCVSYAPLGLLLWVGVDLYGSAKSTSALAVSKIPQWG